jgi:carnitine 3-dehydrogenase
VRAPDQIRTVAVIGAGAIGSSWTALALAHGLDVRAADPAPQAGARLEQAVSGYLADLSSAGQPGNLRFYREAERAVPGADLVLEAGPEQADVKRELFAVLDRVSDPDVLLASSSSGLGPSAFQGRCHYPERVVVTHPFNPPHLIPLVEVVGGASTSENAIAVAMAMMTRLGRQPIRVRAELPGHVVNRLQAALWREAYDLVNRGVVSVADLDAAVASGPGLRWALLGPIATQHLSGGPGGLAHVLDHLGPPMVGWWADLGAPDLTPELARTLVEGVAAEVGGREDELRRQRDQALRELLAIRDRFGLTERP